MTAVKSFRGVVRKTQRAYLRNLKNCTHEIEFFSLLVISLLHFGAPGPLFLKTTKKMLLKSLQNLQGNICAGASFLKKLQNSFTKFLTTPSLQITFWQLILRKFKKEKKLDFYCKRHPLPMKRKFGR